MGRPAVDISALSTEQKLELIDDLWASLAADESELTVAQRAELDRRLDRLEREGPSGTPWESVRAEMTSRPK